MRADEAFDNWYQTRERRLKKLMNGEHNAASAAPCRVRMANDARSLPSRLAAQCRSSFPRRTCTSTWASGPTKTRHGCARPAVRRSRRDAGGDCRAALTQRAQVDPTLTQNFLRHFAECPGKSFLQLTRDQARAGRPVPRRVTERLASSPRLPPARPPRAVHVPGHWHLRTAAVGPGRVVLSVRSQGIGCVTGLPRMPPATQLPSCLSSCKAAFLAALVACLPSLFGWSHSCVC
jgi:hypothetical protein